MYSLAEQAAWSWMHITWGHLGCRRPERLQPVTSSFIIIPHCHDHHHHQHQHNHHHYHHHGCHPIVGGQWIWATGRCLANGGECKIGEAIYKQCSNATIKGEPRTFCKMGGISKKGGDSFPRGPALYLNSSILFLMTTLSPSGCHLNQKYVYTLLRRFLVWLQDWIGEPY